MVGNFCTRRAFLGRASIAAGGLLLARRAVRGGTAGHAWGDRGGRLRFGIVTDIHYADVDPRGNRFCRESDRKLAECVAVMNSEKVDFLIELGDYKDQDSPPEPARTIGFLRHIEDVFAGFRGARYHVLGNHDTDSISKEEFLNHVTNTGVSPSDTYYAFDQGGIRCIVLDANFRADGSPYGRGNNAWDDTMVPEGELSWLKRQLGSAPGPAIVFIHQQLDGHGAYYVRNASDVRSVLQGSGIVLAVFQGHRHEGSYNVVEGIPYYTLQGMIEGHGPESSSYAIAEVGDDNGVVVRGFRRAMSLRLWGGSSPALRRQ